jgi:hypothetical protein
MSAESHDLIVASFALWAGDWAYLNTLIKRGSLDKNNKNSRHDFDDFILRTNENQFNRYKKKRSLFLKDKGLTKYLILETDHIRSTIWYVSNFEYCMKGYLKDLTWEKDFFSFAYHPHNFETAQEKNMEPPMFSTEWISGKNGNCITRIDEMGLIESTYYICDFDLETRQQNAKKHFTEILMKFNDGVPQLRTTELKQDLT